MNIKLIGGKKVILEGFNMEPTYAGLLAGIPTAESNQRLLKSIKYPKDWGNRATLLKKSDLYVSKDVLKPIIYSAWLSSPEPINDKDNEFDGSNLILIWLGDEHKDMSLQDLIVYWVGLVDWDKNAENYQL
jgi:hypothetical protein